ncbi:MULTISPECIES: Rv3235 family protein [Nocardiaceae]|uniref:Uncharacterized protein n=1 Tax=Rhodococcoides corynebacterioides TaxID=53972 RepID=A0ABS2KQV6_9NOCA|nr:MULTISPECIES: Rv3235 family protein [Rhodococcus]MBM7414298.1 hypothetical protein [Rhodococcus corynebacterioides]MBP1116761.1 hypothetical protein [Rhodococcus sp. PvP016]
MTSEVVHVARLPRSEPPEIGAAPARARPTDRSAGRALSSPRPGPHSGRSTPRPNLAVVRPSEADARTAAAARHVADRVLRLTLEVVDRRRPAASLRAVLSPAMVGMATALSTAAVPGRTLGVAVVRTVHVRAAGPVPDGAGHGDVEVFGTYSRGDRVFAVAARLTARRNTTGPAWVLTSLRLS